jgi:hypothetical protein
VGSIPPAGTTPKSCCPNGLGKWIAGASLHRRCTHINLPPATDKYINDLIAQMCMRRPPKRLHVARPKRQRHLIPAYALCHARILCGPSQKKVSPSGSDDLNDKVANSIGEDIKFHTAGRSRFCFAIIAFEESARRWHARKPHINAVSNRKRTGECLSFPKS